MEILTNSSTGRTAGEISETGKNIRNQKKFNSNYSFVKKYFYNFDIN